MKKRILSLVLCAAMLLSMCLFLGAGMTDGSYKVTVNYIYESNSSPVAQATVLQVAKDDTLTKEIAIPKQANYTPKLADGTPSEIALDVDGGLLKFTGFKPTGNVTVNVIYVAGNAKYTVNHYLQNLEDDKYTLKDPVEMTGSIDAYTEAVAKKYDGFTAGEVARSPIAADGTTIVDIYYTRNYYMVQFDANGGVNGPEPIYAKYDTTYNMPEGPTKTGYDFAGWFDSGDHQVTEGIVKANVTYTAHWTPKSNEAGVTVVYWGQNANDNEYSYYGASVLGDQTVGSTITWADIQNQTAYTCGLEEHTHTSDCKLNCVHTVHDLTCYGLSANAQPITPSGEATKYFAKLSGGIQDGYIYHFDDRGSNGQGDQYYLRLNGEYYKYDGTPRANKGAQVGGRVECSEGWGHKTDYFYKYNLTVTCTHKHTAACYSCGKIEHPHTDSCKSALNAKMDSSLWTYEKSDTVTVDAAGNTVMNVYYKRTKFTLTFVLDKAEAEGNYTKTLTEPWGKRIKSDFDLIEAEEKSNLEQFNKTFGTNYHLYAWKDSTTSYNTNNVMIMPSVNKTLTAQAVRGSTELSMYYYAADLQGNYPQEPSFTIKFVNDDSVTVTEDEYYEWEGFEINKEKSTKTGKDANGATFYYDRKAYDLKFFSGNNAVPVKSERPKFEQPLNEFAAFQPNTPPQGVESDAVFAGWYLNPQCTGERYDLSTHTMPANNIALYAKWVNRSYTVTTYTDDTQSARYTYDGYNGVQSVVKYEKGVAPTNPTKSGYAFVGWFYKDENGAEKPFSFEMGITKDYNLYPKWSNQVNVTYTIQYIDRATGNEIADSDTASARMGSTVNVKSKAVAGYFPELTSTSVQITEENQVIKLYYQSGTKLTYTVKYVETVNGVDQDIAPSETQATTSIQVVEFAKNVEGYTPDYYQKTLELTAGGENVVIFYYTKQVTIKYVPLEGGSVTPETETLIRTTGEAHGSTATPDASYKFVGWYNNEECTGDPVSMDATFVPKQVNGVYEGATYYAKFELDVFDLTIKKAAANGSEIDPNQIFVFRVVSDDNKTDMEVTVKGIGSVTIKGLPLGTTYTVTEETDWTWQYTPDKSKEVFTPSGDYSVTFSNTYSKSNWLTSFAEVINKWIDGKIDPIKVKN